MATMDVACAIEADGVVIHLGSHLGAGFDVGLARAVPALERALERTSDTTWLLVEDSAGAGATMGRSVDELVAIFDRIDHPRLGLCLDSCHLWVSGVDVTDPAVARRDARRRRRAHRPRPPARAARERRGEGARLEPRPARDVGKGLMGKGLSACSSATRGSKTCRRCSKPRARRSRARTRRRCGGFKKLHARASPRARDPRQRRFGFVSRSSAPAGVLAGDAVDPSPTRVWKSRTATTSFSP